MPTDATSILLGLVPQGTGWALFVVAVIGLGTIAHRKDQALQEETKAHLASVKEMNDKGQKSAETMAINYAAALDKSTDMARGTYQIVQNLQNLQNSSNMKKQ